MRITFATGAAIVLLAASRLDAQQAPPPPAENRGEGPAAPQARRGRPEEPQFPPQAVAGGRERPAAPCGFSPGSNPRGGSRGTGPAPALMVPSDDKAQQLSE